MSGRSSEKRCWEIRQLAQRPTSDHDKAMEEKFRITDNAVREVAGERTLRVQRLSDHVAKADQDAERVQNLIPQNLELKRSYTAMKEAHNTAILGAVIFGFSVVTIIFTPMSSILALLAVPEKSFLVPETGNAQSIRLWRVKVKLAL
jgi:hypothetical protein